MTGTAPEWLAGEYPYAQAKWSETDQDTVTALARCPNCLDRPGFDGRGRECALCRGTGWTHSLGLDGKAEGWDEHLDRYLHRGKSVV